MATYRAIILTILCCAPVFAQAPQKVSASEVRALEGTWVLDVARSGLTEAEAERRVMSLGPAWLRIDLHRARDKRPVSLIYNLDGSTNVNAFGDGTAVTKLTREGDVIVLETVFTVSKQAVTLRERVPLVPGLNLPVESMLRVEHGYQGVPTSGVRTPPNVSNLTKIFHKDAVSETKER
jgi:hypothetical protein